MPYEIREVDGKQCVFNKDTGENKGCSDSHEMAIQHMRALYAHEPGAKSGPLSLDMTITKAEKTSQGFIRWRARCNTGEVDKQNERFDATFWLDLIHNFMQVQKATSGGDKPALPVPILDVAHYSLFLGENRMKARAGWPVRLWVDGKALMAEGFYDDTPLGKASAAAGMRPEGKRPRISICVYPDWGNVSVEDGVIVYKGGRDLAYLDHFGQTMYPVNVGTDIVAEVSMDKSTLAQDAKEVLGDETLTEELEKARKGVKSEAVPGDVIIKAEDTPAPAAETPVIDDGVVAGEPVAKPAPAAMTPCACGGGVCAKAETPAPIAPVPEVKSDGKPIIYDVALATKDEVMAHSQKLDALAAAFGQLAKTLQPFMTETSATIKSLSEQVEALKVSDTAKVKSAIDNGGDWLARFYNPRNDANNKVSADEVKKAEPQSADKELTGIWGMITQKPGG